MGNVYIFTCPKCGTAYTGTDLNATLAQANACCANKNDDNSDNSDDGDD